MPSPLQQWGGFLNFKAMRTTKELLQLMLDNEQLFFTGMCDWICDLEESEIITYREFSHLRCYIGANEPVNNWLYRLFKIFCYTYGFWFPEGWLWPRRRWIKQHIKLLSQQGM